MNQYAQVVLNMPHPSLDKPFDYAVPESMLCKISVGMRVIVPFGAKNKLTEGYVLSITDHTQVPRIRLKEISSLCEDDFMLLEQFIPIVEWMRQEYHCTYIDAIKCFVPPAAKKVKSPKYMDIISLTASQQQIADFIENNSRRAPVMCKVLMLLMDQPELAKEDIILNTWASTQTFISLKNRGFISIRKEEIYREADAEIQGTNKIVSLTPEQKHCIEVAQEQLSSPEKKPLLLRGVTGSGKTEVYMQITEQTLAMGKSVIMLIPEISLTPQTVANFRGRFGKSIAILNSRLSAGERYDEWRRIRRGEARVVIGARSAIFAPCPNLGAIIIDEEHEDSYKSDNSPRYNACEIAHVRSRVENTLLLMGSATPDVVHYYQASQGDYILLRMENRIGSGFPSVQVCDMRREIELGNRTMFSKPLYDALKEITESDFQGILLLNRRGYAESVSCRSCGFVYKCPHCNVSLTYHKQNNLLKCHYCGYATYMQPLCPSCGSRYIKAFGRGTQKLEQELQGLFPGITVLRMDADTTMTKGAHHRILKAFEEKKYKLLVGTQMVAKGLDFENVVLVGLIAPDMTLNMPEFKSAERVFRLISQASGRAGRGKHPGKVILQSYQPEHYAVQAAVANDYEAFYSADLQMRKMGYYPPFSRILRLLFSSADEAAAQQEAQTAAELLKERLHAFEDSTHILLSPAPIERIHDKYRWHVIAKYSPKDPKPHMLLHQAVNEILEHNDFARVRLAVDFSPSALL